MKVSLYKCNSLKGCPKYISKKELDSLTPLFCKKYDNHELQINAGLYCPSLADLNRR